MISESALVWIANVYMGAFRQLRLEIKAENLLIAEKKKAMDQQEAALSDSPASPIGNQTGNQHRRPQSQLTTNRGAGPTYTTPYCYLP